MAPADWTDAIAFDELWDGAGVPVTVREKELAVFRIGDAVYATDLLCSHGHARLCDGFVEGREIECPLHQGRFSLETGVATAEPAVDPIGCYPTRVIDGRVLIQT